MNLKEIEYIIKIEEEGGITRAAEKLFITPSALNQQLLHLEKEIGTKLFHRSRAGWTPTEAGIIYLRTAREMLRMKKEAYHQLQDIVDTKKGTLSIGFPPERGSKMFTKVYPVFHREYPDILINVVETSVREQQKLINTGELDIGFVTLQNHQKTADIYIPICSEEFILVLPADHPLLSVNGISDTADTGYHELSLTILKDEAFALMYRGSTAYECIDLIFRKAGFTPNILFETSRTHTIIEMAAAGLCCGIIPSSDLRLQTDRVAFFSLPDHPSWEMMATYRKGSYLSQPARRFIELADLYWNGKL